MRYFGTDGIRGVVGDYPITPDFFLRLGFAVGVVLKGHYNRQISVVIGKDTRLSGYLFESSLEAGFCYAGANVYMAGVIPTPAIAYLVRDLRLEAGVVISASHNPYTDNGIKFFDSCGNKLSDELESLIENQLTLDLIKADTLGKVSVVRGAVGRYIDFCKHSCHGMLDLKGFKVVLDCANGATYQVASNVFSELGAQVITTASSPDGTNINLNCGSTHIDNLVGSVLQMNADVGIAFDGDGDRVMMVDKFGAIYNGDKILYILAKYYLHLGLMKDNAAVVGTVMSNMALEIALSDIGIKLLRTKVGDRFILEQLRQNDLLLGSEPSGHIICLDRHVTGDGIIASLLTLLAVTALQQPLQDLITWRDYHQVLINVQLPSRDIAWEDSCSDLIAAASCKLGVSGRVVVRSSGTESVVRVMVEAAQQSDASYWASAIAEKIKNCIKQVAQA